MPTGHALCVEIWLFYDVLSTFWIDLAMQVAMNSPSQQAASVMYSNLATLLSYLLLARRQPMLRDVLSTAL